MVAWIFNSAADTGFEPWLGQTIDSKICICSFSAKHAALTNAGWFVSG